MPTAKEMIALIDEALSVQCIGEIMGMPVIVDKSLEPSMIEIRGKEQTVRFSVDHPLIQGTKLERAAR